MKFVSAVTALIAAMAVGSEAAKAKVSRRELNQRMKNGQFDEKTLLAGAKPHNDAAKKRALGNNYEYYFTGDHSIQFKSCFSLATSYEDMFEGDDEGSTVMNLFSSGQLLAIESYAIFTLYYSTAGTAEEYVVSLDTYLQSLVNYLPDQVEAYCEACQENYDTCYNQMYANGNAGSSSYNYNAYDNNYNGANVNNVNYNYGNRKLLEVERVLANQNQVIRQLDCGLCAEYGCVDYSGDDGDKQEEGDNSFAYASEWLEEISQCKETGVAYQGGYSDGGGYYYNNQQQEEGDDEGLFAGMVCNGEGTGVEIGLFYDDECKLYLPNESFKNYMSYYDSTYMEMTKEVIEFTFSDAVFSCKEQEVIYTTQNVGDYGQNYYQDYDWNQNADEDDIAEWCEGVLMTDYLVDMKTCGNGNNNGYYYSKYNYNQGYDDDELVTQMATYDWYRFEISQEDAEDLGTVCGVARANTMHTFYNTNNGNLYSYGSSSDADFLDSAYTKKGASAGAVFGYIVLFGLIAGAGVAVFLKVQADAKDDKNVGLIDPEEVEQKGGEVA